jgi:hypothetical protein
MGWSSSVRVDAQAGSTEVSKLPTQSDFVPGQRQSPCPGKKGLADVQFMVRETCYFASDYQQEIRDMSIPANMAAKTAVLQFPYTETVRPKSL